MLGRLIGTYLHVLFEATKKKFWGRKATIAMHEVKVLLYLTLILTVGILPVYLLRKKWSEVAVIAGVIVCFFVLNKEFILGRLVAWHDAGQHEYLLLIFKQWLDSGVSLGWNPYMNGGEPFYLFSNSILWAPWPFFCWLNKLINLDSHTLFNLFWIFQFINFSIGGLLLFLVLYDDFKVALFCFVALLISGMFIVNLGQPTGLNIIYYFPYALFCLVSFYRTKNVYGVALAMIFLGISLNHYLPLYILLCTGIFIGFFVLLSLRDTRSLFGVVIRRYRVILLASLISLLAASPAFFLYVEMQDYVSPTRGELQPGGAIEGGETGRQPNVNAPLSGYRVLLEQRVPYRRNIHHAFYFGILPLLVIPHAFFRWRSRFMWAVMSSALLILLLGTGNDFWGYRMLIEHVPGFNMLRHSFGLAHFVGFLLICLSGYGLRELLQKDADKKRNVNLSIVIFLAYVAAILISRKQNVVLFSALGSFSLLILINTNRVGLFHGRAGKYIKIGCYLSVLSVLVIDVTVHYDRYHRLSLLTEDPIVLNDIVYPERRTFYPKIGYMIPIDIAPLMLKKAALTHPDDNFILFRNAHLNDMLKFIDDEKGHEQALGVEGRLVHFTRGVKVVPEGVSKEDFIRSVFRESGDQSLERGGNVVFSEQDVNFTSSYNHTGEEGGIEQIKSEDPNEVEFTVDAPGDGFLVRLENYHRGWKGFVDDRQSPVLRANYAFQAIGVPEGKHKVKFRFSTIYPSLMYVHIFCVFVNWLLFNVYLHSTGGRCREKECI
jgi:hypothetical protein